MVLDERYPNPDVDAKVLLVSMPFGPLMMPSIGLGLLKEVLRRHQVRANVFYFNIDFAKLIGPKVYSKIAAGAPANHDLAGEWLFSHTLFEGRRADPRDYIDAVLMGGQKAHRKDRGSLRAPSEEFIAELLSARDHALTFIEGCVDRLLALDPKIVGFTSVFQQNVASLAVARRLKELRPSVFTMLGGANCESVMGKEMLERFSFVDAVISGEAEETLPAVVRCVLAGTALPEIPGAMLRAAKKKLSLVTGTKTTSTAALSNMDALPTPNYDEYFEQFTGADLKIESPPHVLFETARGCWWGEKNHCTFCGLNGETMAFRSKSAARALEELKEITSRHPGHPVSVVDNILSMSYFRDFVPALAEQGLDADLFYEVKSNLTKDQVRLLSEARISRIQPGVESLSDQVLTIMRKGVRAIQNVQLLKWCKEFGIKPEWNFLWGFPGEDPGEYEKMARLVPRLGHLPPPHGGNPIRLDRFSPNFTQSDQLGFKDVEPYPAYGFVYDLPEEALGNMAYYFTYEYKDGRRVPEYVAPLAATLPQWQEEYEGSDLLAVDKGEHLLLLDFRSCAATTVRVLDGFDRWLYLECDAARTVDALVARAVQAGIPDADSARVRAALGQFDSDGLMLSDGRLHLSLAIPLGVYSPGARVLEKILGLSGGADAPDADTLDSAPDSSQAVVAQRG